MPSRRLLKSSSFDVAIIGGGPGGSATAISLRAHAPSLSVVLIEASHYDGVRVGETLPPQARSILDHLEVWDEFCRLSPRNVFGTSAAWGRPVEAWTSGNFCQPRWKRQLRRFLHRRAEAGSGTIIRALLSTT